MVLLITQLLEGTIPLSHQLRCLLTDMGMLRCPLYSFTLEIVNSLQVSTTLLCALTSHIAP